MGENKAKKIFHIRRGHLLGVALCIFDMVISNLSYFLMLLFRYDFIFSNIPYEQYRAWYLFFGIYCAIIAATFVLFKLYRSIWKFASYIEAYRCLLATLVSGVLHGALITLIFSPMPVSYYVGGPVVQLCFVLGIRFSYRFFLLLQKKIKSDNASLYNVMIIGAGNAGQLLIRDIHTNNDSKDKVVCVIDDNHNLWNKDIEGVPVVGGRDVILRMVKKEKYYSGTRF